MKKLGAFLCAVILVFWLAGSAAAAYITFTDITTFTATGTNPAEDYVSHGRGEVNFLEWTGDYVTWTHHFDFFPAAKEVISAELTLSLRDNENDSIWNIFTWDIAFLFAEDGTWGFQGVSTSDYTYNLDATSLMDGTFTVTLGALWGDFYIEQSSLEIMYNPVPIPSTVLLFLSGLLGLIGLGRRVR
jgi:hypothetical protein